MNAPIRPSLLTMAIVIGVSTSLSADSSSNADRWRGVWIGLEKASEPNQWICFRKNIQVDSTRSKAVARIACDSKYWLWINGQLVVREGQLKRGPTPESTYFDQIDLSERLQHGQNSIAILVWYFGKDGFSHHSSGKAGLVFDCTFEEQHIGSDETWRAAEHPAFGETDPPHPNYRLPESNIRFDGQRAFNDSADNDWFQPEFDDSSWQFATPFGRPPSQPWGELHRRPIPLWKDFGLKRYKNASEIGLPRVSDGQVIRAKLPYNAQVNPTLTVRSKTGKTIDIRTDHYRGGGPPNVRAEYVTRDGLQTYENLGWMNGHEVLYQIPKGVEIIDLKYRETGFDTEFAGRFQCDDPFLNRLRQKAERTLYVTMRDTYFDCPDRERAQWWGDVVLEMGESFYALDVKSHSLAKKGILELMAWQREDDTIFSPVPAGNYDSELPMQMLASVGQFGFWTYALHTGDLKTIEQVYPRVKRYLALWKIDDDGLVIPRKGGWTWGDWGKNKDMPLLFNGWYFLALKGQANMAKALGNNQEVANLKEKMELLQVAFNKRFWTGAEYRSPQYKGPTDDRGHALAVVSGIAETEKLEAIAEVFKKQLHSSPYMEKYVLEALYQMRRPNQAIARMRKRYGKMVASEITTLWEGWGIGPEGFGGGTTNHAWSGGPLTIMSQYIAGIEPAEPGFTKFEIRPQLGTLKSVQAVVQTVSGEIKVDISDSDRRFEMKVTSPTGTSGTIYIPAGQANEITEGTKLLWSRSGSPEPTQGDAQIRFSHEDKNYVAFEVAAGTYEFISNR